MSRIEFHVCPKAKDLLEASDLATFEKLMFTAGGEMLSSEERAQTLRLELPFPNAPICFLKRTLAHRHRKNAQALLRFKRPHTDVYREMQLAKELQNAGVSVMRVLAWGEERRFGLPNRGFILTEGVQGESLHQMFVSGDGEMRLRIASAFGKFVARLHTLGFFQVVRLKDLICSVSNDAPQGLSLTLIDRASYRTGRKFFWSRFCVQSLQRGFRRMKRDRIVFESDSEKSFAEAYAEGVADKWQIEPSALRSRLR